MQIWQVNPKFKKSKKFLKWQDSGLRKRNQELQRRTIEQECAVMGEPATCGQLDRISLEARPERLPGSCCSGFLHWIRELPIEGRNPVFWSCLASLISEPVFYQCVSREKAGDSSRLLFPVNYVKDPGSHIGLCNCCRQLGNEQGIEDFSHCLSAFQVKQQNFPNSVAQLFLCASASTFLTESKYSCDLSLFHCSVLAAWEYGGEIALLSS